MLRFLGVLIIAVTVIIIYEGSSYFYNPTSISIKDVYGQDMLDRSIAHKGTSSRLKNKIKYALEGNPIRFGVLGGSSSYGHGLPERTKETYHARVFQWWNEQFPHDRNTIVNGAIPATDSTYFTYCYDKHIPNDLDIIFIEFSINDASIYPTYKGNGNIKVTQHMESLIRNLLQMPNKPAIIFVSFYIFGHGHYFNGQEAHLPVVNYYDIPMISTKNVFFDYLNRNPDNNDIIFYQDQIHPSRDGHKIMSDFIIWYINDLLNPFRRGEPSNFVREVGVRMTSSRIPDVPMVDMWLTRNDTFIELEPKCQTFRDENYRPFNISPSESWYLMNWQNEKFYLAADKPGSNVTFRIDVNKGEVYMYFLRSRQYSLGNAWCWVNDDYKHGTELKGYWDDKKSVGSMKMVAHDLDKGEYDIHCTLLSKSDNPDKGNHFRIISVFSG